jgi:uncharacterized protein (DUF1501 family)
MSKNETGCPEYQSLSRRQFLGGASVATAGAVLGASWLPQVAFANGGPNRDVIISIYLRGGADGLSLCVPYADNNYYAVRPNIAIPRPDSSSQYRATNLDGFFGFPPAMTPLLQAYRDRKLLIAHAVGAAGWTRSHFDAQYWMETAKGSQLLPRTGWLGRHLSTVAPMSPTAPLRGVSISHGLVRTMVGGNKTIPIPNLDDYDYSGDFNHQPELNQTLASMYNAHTDDMKVALGVAQVTISMLNRINFDGYTPSGGAVYDDNDWFAYSMKSAAALIKANVGVEAIHLDLDGWDTHANQGSQNGDLANLMGRLARSLAAFYRDMSSANRMNWTLVVLSEFGRNVGENNSRGTDHGTANACLIMGGAVAGGRVLRNWPGLAPSQLLDGIDLRPTIDYRDILSEIVSKRGANTNLAAVFPGYSPRFRGVIAA